MLTFHVIATSLLLAATQPVSADIIATCNSQHNTSGTKKTITHSRTAVAMGSFVFMGEQFPEIKPEQFTLQTTIAAQNRDVFLFMDDWYPKMPLEQLSISPNADQTFLFMEERYSSLPEEEIMLPMHSNSQ